MLKSVVSTLNISLYWNKKYIRESWLIKEINQYFLFFKVEKKFLELFYAYSIFFVKILSLQMVHHTTWFSEKITY